MGDKSDPIEPLFKYLRLACDLREIIKTTSISCINANTKVIFVGTAWGDLCILDHEGNINSHQKFPKHIVGINRISADIKGEFIGTCSDDGQVHINSFCSDESPVVLKLERQVKCIELDPLYSKSNSRRFIVGDSKLTLYERSFFSSLKSTVLCEAEGFVNAVSWSGQFVAWASSIGVRVYDLEERCSLGLIKWDEPREGKLGDFRCNLKWSNNSTLLIGWVETIRICVIRKRNSIEVSTKNLPGFIVDPISTFRTEFYISGLAPLDKNQLVVLGVPKEKNESNQNPRPVLCAIRYECNDYEEICSDILTLNGYENYTPNDYSLESLIDENKYFIVSPKDVVSASSYETDDRVKWLIEHDMFEKALKVISEKKGKHTEVEVCRLYVDHLLGQEQYEEAAKLCSRVFENNKELWEEEVYKFVKVKKLRFVSPYLPRSIDSKLNPQVYEMVLYDYLKSDREGFLQLIKEWTPNLYNPSAVINAIQNLFDKKDKNILLEALAILYSHEREYDKALTVYLKLQHKDVFQLIKKHNLYNTIHSMIVELINLDSEKAISLLLERNKISPEVVVGELRSHEHFLFLYLDSLDKIDSSGKFDWELVNLYAKYNREKLLSFLKRSRTYPLQEAYELCKNKLFYPEMVYLLDRMGDSTQALTIIMKNLKDVSMAIEFCREHNDLELWDFLVNEGVDKPEIITKLLDGIAGFMINPEMLIERIKLEQEIPGLKDSLVNMLNGFNLQVSIHEGCNKILETDYFNLHEKLVKQQERGLNVTSDLTCCLCHRDIFVKDKDCSKASDVIVFNCKHLYHDSCVPEKFNLDFCAMCKNQ